MKALQNPWVGASLAAVALFCVAAVVFLFPPDRHTFFPRCGFQSLTGLYCPGCGSTRAMHYLLQGDFIAALDCNALFVFLLPLIAESFFVRTRRGWSWLQHPIAGWTVLVVLLGFAVLRNLPVLPFSLLAP